MVIDRCAGEELKHQGEIERSMYPRNPAIDQQEQCSKQGLMGLRRLCTCQGPQSCDFKIGRSDESLPHDAMICEDLGTRWQEGSDEADGLTRRIVGFRCVSDFEIFGFGV